MVERGKIAKFALENPHENCEETYMVFDHPRDYVSGVGIQVWLTCDLEGLLLFIEAGDYQPIITLESDGKPQTKFELYSSELLLIQNIAETLVGKYDLSKLGDGEKPSVRLRA